LYVRHRAGSLETVVAKTRWRNLAVTGGLLLLIIASAAALLRFTRRSERLAELQMNFVAGVSHELRTPLTVINTAAYNLQSKVSRNPEQVVKYGALIRQESGRLKELVEQVLSFAGSQAGRMTQETQPLAVENLIEASLESSKPVIEAGHFEVDKEITPGLPLIAGDARALQHAIQNLLTNAVKYGGGEANWIGISARLAKADGGEAIEIRVADHGPGIPAEEQRHIFDPFYRGKRAIQDQVHGTGLGLTLVKEIVTAHRGTISVRSQPEKGTEFVVRIPAAPQSHQDEFANTASRG
jgi:signal transduction histidine kinase